MSLSFTVSHQEPTSYVVTCGCDAATARATPCASYAAACTAAAATKQPLAGCSWPEICADYPLHVYGLDPRGAAPEVNVHNLTAVRLLDLLGLPRFAEPAAEHSASPTPEPDTAREGMAIEVVVLDAYGQMPAEEFLGRVLLALALTPRDCGTDGYWSGRSHRGGRAPGRLQQLLAELHALAEWCAANGGEVAWH